jgi:transcriptional regulator with XRE-family HTH domain
MSAILKNVRRLIEASGVSRYRISKETGIPQSQLSRIMAGDVGLSLAALERLAKYLHWTITIEPMRRKGR